jgi:hypothetical protein
MIYNLCKNYNYLKFIITNINCYRFPNCTDMFPSVLFRFRFSDISDIVFVSDFTVSDFVSEKNMVTEMVEAIFRSFPTVFIPIYNQRPYALSSYLQPTQSSSKATSESSQPRPLRSKCI